MYKELLAMPDPDPLYYTYAAACEYYMGMYKEAEATALKVRHNKLQLSGHEGHDKPWATDHSLHTPPAERGAAMLQSNLPWHNALMLSQEQLYSSASSAAATL